MEFEQKISTLRANSKSESLTLAQDLVTRNTTAIFKTLQDFEPRRRPDLCMTDEARGRLQEWITLGEKTLDSHSGLTVSNIVQSPDIRFQGHKSQEHQTEQEKENGDEQLEVFKASASTAPVGISDVLSSVLWPKPPASRRPSVHKHAQTRVLAREWEQVRVRMQTNERARNLISMENASIFSKLSLVLKKVFSPSALRRLWFPSVMLAPNVNLKRPQDISKLLDFQQKIAPNFDWDGHWRWAQSWDERKKENWEFEWSWELDWDREWQLKEEQEWQRRHARWWTDTQKWPPKEPECKSKKTRHRSEVGVWASTIRNEINWLKRDGSLFPHDWDETTWLMQQLWWRDFEMWTGRWKERKRAVDEFSTTCLALVKELENIDGTALAQELNTFERFDSSKWIGASENQRIVVRYIADMRDAMTYFDKGRFMGCCNSMLKLISGELRSDEIRKGSIFELSKLLTRCRSK